MTRQDHIEAVARAICQENCACIGERPCYAVEGAWPNPNCDEPGCHAQATAAISALEKCGAYVGDGWVAVPSEPTREMWQAGCGELGSKQGLTACWKAMLSAATKPAQGKGE